MNRDRFDFETMVRRARAEQSPAIDVASQVANRIRTCTSQSVNDRLLWVAAGVSVVGGVLAVLLALQQGVFFDDPLASWLRPLIVTMQ